MALINLAHIDKLRTQAHLRKCVAHSYAFLPKKETPEEMDDELFVDIIRCSQQAENLVKQLRKVHEVCVDFASGNMQKYIEGHGEYDVDGPFDPFAEIEYPFNSETIHDLPSRIEQYEELCDLSGRYVHQQQLQDQALTEMFPSLTRFVAVIEDDQPVLVPEQDLPNEVRDQQDYRLQASRIDVEYCLDGYNAFYKECLRLIESGRINNDVEGCALGILAMISN